jgi:5-formyltetrahydrofolate cyclo-ligase
LGKRQKRNELRAELRKVVASLDERWMRAASAEVCTNLGSIIQQVEEQSPSHRIERVLAWTSFFPGEVDLAPFISTQLSKRRVYLPRSLPDYSMNFISIGQRWMDDAQTGDLGIPEPSQDKGESYERKDVSDTLVVVPGLAFDRSGNRIGRGKGYYDRFLGSPAMKGALKVGVMWSLQLLDEVPVESHDIPMDWICHEEGFKYVGAEFDDEL